MPEASVVPETTPVVAPVPPAKEGTFVRRRKRRDINEFSPTLCKENECTNPYVAFSPKPQNVHFESQDTEERIVLFVRKHMITNAGWVFASIVLIIMPFFLRYVPFIDFFPERFHLITIAGWYVFVLGYILENYLTWFFNVNIFTDERVIDIDFYSLLSKKISSAQIDRIEDVTNSVNGFLGSILDYGTIDIQTAAKERELRFEQIPQPEKVTKVLNELILEEEQETLDGRAR